MSREAASEVSDGREWISRCSDEVFAGRWGEVLEGRSRERRAPGDQRSHAPAKPSQQRHRGAGPPKKIRIWNPSTRVEGEESARPEEN